MAFLGADSTSTADWTSPTKRADGYDTIRGAIVSNQAGSLKVQQSMDNTNWDIEDSISVVASTPVKIDDLKIYLPFIRLFFDNSGSTVPTTFRVHARLHAAGDS